MCLLQSAWDAKNGALSSPLKEVGILEAVGVNCRPIFVTKVDGWRLPRLISSLFLTQWLNDLFTCCKALAKHGQKKNNLNFCHCGSGLLWIISERCKPYSIPMWGVSSTNAMCFLMSSICTSTRGQRKLEKNTKEATTFFAQGCISQMQSTPQKTSFFRLNFCSTFKVSSKIWDNLQTLLDTRTQRGQPCWKQVTSRFHHLGDSKVANFSPSNLLSNH